MENSLKKALSLFVTLPLWIFGHIKNPHVVAGHATFEKEGQTQTCHAADKTVINCKSFNVGQGEKVHFKQPSKKAAVLCRVTGDERSLIEGLLEADGRLVLINPRSIVFRETAQVNVHSLIASTLDIRDDDFIKGNYRFSLHSDATESEIVNKGQITAAQDAVFMAPKIFSQGVIKATAGNIAYLGGKLITLKFTDDNLISFAIDDSLKTSFVELAGKIEAANGRVFVNFRTADEIIRSVVNTNGLSEAVTIVREHGMIRLVPGCSITAKALEVEGHKVETAADFNVQGQVSITGQKGVRWVGGKNLSSHKQAELSLRSLECVILDAPFGNEKTSSFEKLRFEGKTIYQNHLVRSKGPQVYKAEKIFLRDNIYTSGKNILFDGRVILDGRDALTITTGYGGAPEIIFKEGLDADSSRTLEINNGNGTVTFVRPIGESGPLGTLKISSGNLSLNNVGGKNAGVKHLTVNAETTNLTGTVYHAGEYAWKERGEINVKSGQPTTLMTSGDVLNFKKVKVMNLDPNTVMTFKTLGGDLVLCSLLGQDLQPITIDSGHGLVKLGELGGKLGHLKVQGHGIHFGGKIDVESIFMEAEGNIRYGTSEDGKPLQTSILAKKDVILNAKHGSIGAEGEKEDILVNTEGKFYVGAKGIAYVAGTCQNGYPSIYEKNPPTHIRYNGGEPVSCYPPDDFLMEEEELQMSLSPHLFHTAPNGFIDGTTLTPRRAPIYYQVK